MEETKDPKARGAASARDEDATSSETLSDIEAGEKVAGAGGGSAGSESSRLETSSPDPEAGGEGRADGGDAGGPM